jgi:agmatinase
LAQEHKYEGKVPLQDQYGPEARCASKQKHCSTRAAPDSIKDRRIPTFSRGELPHFAGINIFVKAPYVEDVSKCGQYDVAILVNLRVLLRSLHRRHIGHFQRREPSQRQ